MSAWFKLWETLTVCIFNHVFTSPCVEPADPVFHNHNGLISLETNQIKHWQKGKKIRKTEYNRWKCRNLHFSLLSKSAPLPLTHRPLVSPLLLHIHDRHSPPHLKCLPAPPGEPHLESPTCNPALSPGKLVLKESALDTWRPDCNSSWANWGSKDTVLVSSETQLKSRSEPHCQPLHYVAYEEYH